MDDIYTGEITVKKFVKFVWPSVLMMVIIALYYGMDSVFVANLAGEEALAALSIAYPVQGIIWGISVMLASGSSAIVAIKMGEGRQQEADEKYSSICVVSLILGCVLTAAGLVFMDEIVSFLGATESLAQYCEEFLTILVWACPGAFLGVLFEYFIRVDGRPGFTLILYLSGGVTHLLLDYILMGPLEMGIKGTAWANLGGLYIIMILGGGYFLFMKTKLSLRRFRPDWRFIGHSFANGSSELVSESSAGITTFFFNYVTIALAGEVGAAAVSIVLNVHYMMISLHLGYIMGAAPLISYFYGAKEYDKVNVIIKYSKVFVVFTSIVSAAACLIFARYIVMAFERPGSELFDIALTGARLLAPALLLGGINIFASGFFTAYGNGKLSAVISASRALVMVIFWLIIMSHLLGMAGVWLSLTLAELATIVLTFRMLLRHKDIYHYRLR